MDVKVGLTIIQPFIPHYRREFFKKLANKFDLNILCIRKPNQTENFNLDEQNPVQYIKTIRFKQFYLFNPFSKIILKNKIIVINPDFRWVGLIPMILCKKLLNIKILLWTQGVSIKRGFNPNSTIDKIKIFIYNQSDGLIFYTKNELDIMKPYLKNLKLNYLNNTIDINKIFNVSIENKRSKKSLKNKYNIHSSRILIFCARFIKDRRADLLLKLIQRLINRDVHWLIIGEGTSRPDFSPYQNVSYFGPVYDLNKKAELFALADYSFQPAWTGLTIVESFAFGVPYITFKKSSKIYQSAEYGYLIDGKNGHIIDNLERAESIICNSTDQRINEMKLFCRKYVKANLQLEDMVKNFSKMI